MRQRSVICHTFATSTCNTFSSSSSPSSTSSAAYSTRNMTSSTAPATVDYSHRSAPSSLSIHHSLPLTSLYSMYTRQQPVLRSLLHSTRRVTSLLLVTLILINLAPSDAKPYASKRLSFGESMDWSFGGWTPLSESSKSDFTSFPLHEGRSSGGFALPANHNQVPSSTADDDQSIGRSHNSSIGSNGTLESSSSSQSYRVVDLMNQAPQPYLGLSSNGGEEQLSQIAAGALYHLQQQSSQYFPGLPPQPYTRQADKSNPSYQVVPQVPVPKIKVAVEPKPLREARIEAYKVIEHLEANADKVLNSPKANSPIYKGQLDDNYHQQPQQQQQSRYQVQQQQSQYEIQQQDAGPTYEIQYKPQRQMSRYPQPSAYQRQNQYQQQQQQLHQQHQQQQQNLHQQQQQQNLHHHQQQQQSQQYEQQQQSLYHSGQIQYKQAVNLYDNNQITDGQEYDKLNGNGKSKTIVLPVKEVGKDYVTVPVAVETDSDQVLTAEDIKEIEHAVLKAIPETIGNYADKIPDHLYETALPINEVAKGQDYKTIELPPVIIPAGEGAHYGQMNNGLNNGGWSSYMSHMPNFMPNFMSAISPSKGKISDLLRPLLSLVRPIHANSPLPPASPAQRVKGIADVPIIPGNAPYAGSHRPENLDVIHIIANHKSGPEPSVYHINQLAPSPSLSMTRGQHGNELNFRS